MKSWSRPVVAHVLLLAVVLVWGSTFVLVKDALRDISPLLFNLLRTALALLVLGVVYRKHLATIDRRILAKGSLVGFFLGAGYQFQTWGLGITTPSKSAFITGFAVALVPVLLIFPPLRSKKGVAPNLGALLGAAAALAGLALLTLPGQSSWSSLLSSVNTGDLLTLIGAFFFALQIISIAKFSADMRFEHMCLIQIGFATLLMACTGPFFEHAHLVWSQTLIVALIITAVLGTAAAFAIQSFAQEILPATTVVMLMILEPVFATITSYIFFNERLSSRQVVGAVLILIGILATEFLPKLSWMPRRPVALQED